MSVTTHRGYWWLPGLPDDVAAGQLVVDDDTGRCHLELVGSLDLRTAAVLENFGDEDAKAIEQERVHVVHGRVRGKPVTLLNCYAGAADGVVHGGRSFMDIVVQEALLGAHVEHEEPAFRYAIVEIENLTGWLGIDDVITRDRDEDGEKAVVGRADDLTAEVNGWRIVARRVPKPFQVGRSHARATVGGSIDGFLVLHPTEPRPLRDFHGVVLKIMDLLTLASGRPCGQIALTLIHRDDEVVRDRDGSRFVIDTRVESFGGRIHTARPEEASPRDWDFLFRRADLPFEQLVPAWIQLRRATADACNVFFGLRYARPTFTEARLLLVSTVAQALHAGLRGPEAVTYRTRLIELSQIPDAEAVHSVITDVETWSKDLLRARNSLAHTGNDDARSDIFELEWVTSSLLSLVFMAELGLPADVQRRAASTVLPLPWSRTRT